MVAIINCVLAFSLFASGRSSADVPSCQASGSCDGNDDAMLIQSARSSTATVSKMLRDGQSATQLLDKINDMADRIVTGKEKITDATRLALDSIDGEMDNIITHAKSNSVDFQKVVERAAESIEQCASTTRKAHDKELGEEGIDALAAAVASSRNDHITCRTDEAVLKGDETTKCDALKTYVDGLTMPTCTCSDTPVTKQCVTELSTWSATASSTWSTHQGLCNNATTAQSTKRTACNGQQGALESVFCSYKTSLSLVCRTQDTCRLDEIALRNKAHESVEVSESAFKAEYESAKHVKCILQVLNATDDAKQGMLSDCRSASVDSSNLTITYPPIPGPANCDRSPVSHPPGDDKWRTDEYQGKTWNADGKAPVVATAANCAAEATSTTAVPATTAAPTTAAATSTTAVPATTAAPTTAVPMTGSSIVVPFTSSGIYEFTFTVSSEWSGTPAIILDRRGHQGHVLYVSSDKKLGFQQTSRGGRQSAAFASTNTISIGTAYTGSLEWSIVEGGLNRLAINGQNWGSSPEADGFSWSPENKPIQLGFSDDSYWTSGKVEIYSFANPQACVDVSGGWFDAPHWFNPVYFTQSACIGSNPTTNSAGTVVTDMTRFTVQGNEITWTNGAQLSATVDTNGATYDVMTWSNGATWERNKKQA